MIAFITKNWKLDLIGLKITFVEESSLFFNYFVSGYSLPFSTLLPVEIDLNLGFVSENNIIDYPTKYEGFLQIDGGFTTAILEIDEYDGERLSGSFVYGAQSLEVLNTKLINL